MKKILFTALCFISFALSASAADWPRQEISKVISFSFPAQPNISRIDEQSNYLHQTDSCMYLVQVAPFKDDAKVHDSITLAAFYNGMAKGILRGSKGTFVKKDSLKVAGLSALEVEYVKADQQKLPVTVCTRALLVNGTVVVYSFSAPSIRYDRMKPLKEKFFSSILFAKNTDLIQYKTLTPDSTPIPSAVPQATLAKSDTIAKAPVAPVRFLDSHAGWVVKLFGVLILFSAAIYFFSILSRRKG